MFKPRPITLLSEALTRLATRNPGRTEADVQADVRDVLLHGEFDLGEEQVRLESPAPDRRRIDVEVGSLVIECKRDLRPSKILPEAEKQLGGYLADRQAANTGTYVGVLTDGVSWRCYRTANDKVELVTSLDLRPGQIDERRFRWWLGAILATEHQITPTASSIEERLGSESPGCQLALDDLTDLWAAAAGKRDAQLKRALWAKLLRTALGTQFEDTDALFVQHTYLVVVATLIAHVVIGYPPSDLRADPSSALSGQLFAQVGIRGVGEAGFFDWVLDTSGGEDIVVDIARRLSVFSWEGVDHDVLKSLYESVIDFRTRKRLGEYYTPDWLAKRIVETTVLDPLEERVLDPACGSGTFLFHAIRRHLDAADQACVPLSQAVSGVTGHVCGMDLHPVAVVLAQVTYLLAIGTDRITQAGSELSIPVYLGDSMRWDIAEETFLSPEGEIVVPTGLGQKLPGMEEELRFPASIVSDPDRFDRLVDDLASRASDREPHSKPHPIRGLLDSYGVSTTERPVVETTYRHFCELHDEGRNHIWGFFVRNQARPTWFAAVKNRADVVIGNPPWLSYRNMPEEMQRVFERRSKERKLWAGGARGRSTQHDLSAFFVARSVELFLRVGGRFGFVMPLAALSRQTYAGFRDGDFSSPNETCAVAFEIPWDLDKVKPDPFRVPASVVLGRRIAPTTHDDIVRLPNNHLVAEGQLDEELGADSGQTLSWTLATSGENETTYTSANSPYAHRFRQGAILVPRMLFFVEREPPRPLQPATRVSVRSRRGRIGWEPWRSLPDQTGIVEKIFVRRAYLGEHCLPFRMLDPFEVVIPYDGKKLLSAEDETIDRYPGLAEWWRRAEQVWLANRSSEKRTLLGQLDYIGQLSAQLPIPPIRVVYTASGSTLAASVINDAQAVVEHKLYWSSAASLDEARYLAGILNSPALGEIVGPYQSRGAFGARDFDKYVWYPPIPEYDGENTEHRSLVEISTQAEQRMNEIEIPSGTGFQRARKLMRDSLKSEGLLDNADALVRSLLKTPS